MQEKYSIHDEVNLQEYIGVLLRRRMTLFIVFIVTVALGSLITFFMPRLYESGATIRLGVVPSATFQEIADLYFRNTR